MSAHRATRVRRYIGRSAALQLLLFIVILFVVLLAGEYTRLIPA
jgi:hypothetical protein